MALVAQSASARILYIDIVELVRGCEFEPHLEQVLLELKYDLSSKFIGNKCNDIEN